MSSVLMTPLIGLPQATGWSQVIFPTHRRFVCAVSIEGENAGNVGRDVAEVLLNAEVSTAADLHTLITSALKEVHDRACELQLSAALFLDDHCVFGVVRGALLLKRQSKVGVVLLSAGEVKLVEGHIYPHDVCVLLTQEALAFAGEIQQKLLRGYDTDTTVTSVVPGVHSLADSSRIALAFVSKGEVRPDEDESPELESEPHPAVPPVSAAVFRPEVSAEPAITPSLVNDQFSSQPTGEVTPVEPYRSRINRPPVPLPKLKLPVLPNPKVTLVRVAGLLVKVVRRVASWRPPSSTAVYINQPRSKKWWLWLVAIGIGVAVVALGFWQWQARQARAQAAVQAELEPLRAELVAAQGLADSDPLTARDRMAAVLDKFHQLQTQYQNQPGLKKIVDQEAIQAQQIYEEVSGKDELQELAVFFDLRLVQSDFVASKGLVLSEHAYFLDTGRKELLSLAVATKNPQLVTLASLSRVTDLTADAEQLLILGNGLYAADVAQGLNLTGVIEEGDSNREAGLVGTYNSYVYVLNAAKRNIFRYAPKAEGGYTEPIGWLKPGAKIDLSLVASWAIDGDIWLGQTDGQIQKLTSGEVSGFEIKGLSEPLSSPSQVYTTVELEELYVLESAKQRVLVIKKDGTFLRQISSPTLASATSLMVSSPLQKILVVSGSLVFEIPLI